MRLVPGRPTCRRIAALDFEIERWHRNPETGVYLRLGLLVSSRAAWRARTDQGDWYSWTLPGGIVLAYRLTTLPARSESPVDCERN